MSDVENLNSDADVDVSDTNVAGTTIGSIQFIPRQYVTKQKITLQHASDCIFPGEDVTPNEKLNALNDLKTKAKQWSRNEISKIVTNELQNHDLHFKKVIQNKEN